MISLDFLNRDEQIQQQAIYMGLQLATPTSIHLRTMLFVSILAAEKCVRK